MKLNEQCADKQRWLTECADYQDLRETAKQLDTWSKQVLGVLSSSDVGDSVLAVQSLLSKQASVEHSIHAQTAPQGPFDSLEQRATEMLRKNFTQTDAIRRILVDLKTRRSELAASATSRRAALEDALAFQHFLLNYYETMQWIKEKTSSALDKTYLDLTNMQTKIQRHQAFMGELRKVGVKRVDDVHREANVILERHQANTVGPSRILSEIEENIKVKIASL